MCQSPLLKMHNYFEVKGTKSAELFKNIYFTVYQVIISNEIQNISMNVK